jgi:hypothetical protein
VATQRDAVEQHPQAPVEIVLDRRLHGDLRQRLDVRVLLARDGADPLRLTPTIVEDVVRAVTRRGRRYVPIVGPPGGLAMVTAPGAEAGWHSTVPPGFRFDNRIAAADAVPW